MSTKARRRHETFAHAHPAQIAAQRVDLAVVAEESIWVSEPPGREGVGRKAGVDQRDRAREIGIAKVGVESGELIGAEHPLVDHRPRGEARHVTVSSTRYPA